MEQNAADDQAEADAASRSGGADQASNGIERRGQPTVTQPFAPQSPWSQPPIHRPATAHRPRAVPVDPARRARPPSRPRSPPPLPTAAATGAAAPAERPPSRSEPGRQPLPARNGGHVYAGASLPTERGADRRRRRRADARARPGRPGTRPEPPVHPLSRPRTAADLRRSPRRGVRHPPRGASTRVGGHDRRTRGGPARHVRPGPAAPEPARAGGPGQPGRGPARVRRAAPDHRGEPEGRRRQDGGDAHARAHLRPDPGRLRAGLGQQRDPGHAGHAGPAGRARADRPGPAARPRPVRRRAAAASASWPPTCGPRRTRRSTCSPRTRPPPPARC